MITIPSDVETLARLPALTTGRTPEDVIRMAVEASVCDAGLTRPAISGPERDAMIEAALAIADRSARRPLLDNRTEDEILGGRELTAGDRGRPRPMIALFSDIE